MLRFCDKRFKIFILSLFALFILTPILVFAIDAINTVKGGWTQYKNNGNYIRPVYWNTTNDYNTITTSTGACIINNFSNDYFVPTRTFLEWSFFTSKMNSLLMILTNGAGLPNNSCMNGTCVAPAETCGNTKCNYNIVQKLSEKI